MYLRYCYTTGHWKYELLYDFEYELEIFKPGVVVKDYYELWGTTLILKKGYTWDGATCAPDLDCVMTASAIHDCLYQLIENDITGSSKLNREYADKEFKRVCVEEGMPRWLSWVYYVGVRLGYPLKVKLFGK